VYVVSLVWPSHRAFFTPGQMQVQTPAGPMMVQVPADKKPGDMFTFMVPAPAMPQQPVMAVGQVIQPQVAPQMAVAGYPAGYPATGQQVAGYPATGQQVMMVQPVVAMAPVRHVTHFNRVSTMATCMHCQHTGPTVVQYDPGCGAWLICGGLAAIGCWMGCCLIPFCIDDCKDAIHTCGNCHRVLGEKKVIS